MKFLECFYPPSQHFSVVKAFNRFFVFRRKVALCQSGRMAHALSEIFGLENVDGTSDDVLKRWFELEIEIGPENEI